MSDALFKCPHCERQLSASEEMEGTSISCPSCGNILTVPIRIVLPQEDNASDTDSRLQEGSTCPYCRMPLTGEDVARVCPSCHTPHHAECWAENKGCTVFGCPQAPDDEETISVTPSSLTRSTGPCPSALPSQLKTNAPGATSSLVWAILGFFFCGLIFGIVAISNANKAKKLIREQPDIYTGDGLATAGLVVGVIELVVWGLMFLVGLAGG